MELLALEMEITWNYVRTRNGYHRRNIVDEAEQIIQRFEEAISHYSLSRAQWNIIPVDKTENEHNE